MVRFCVKLATTSYDQRLPNSNKRLNSPWKFRNHYWRVNLTSHIDKTFRFWSYIRSCALDSDYYLNYKNVYLDMSLIPWCPFSEFQETFCKFIVPGMVTTEDDMLPLDLEGANIFRFFQISFRILVSGHGMKNNWIDRFIFSSK